MPDEFKQPEGLVFVAELWEYLPLENKYKKNAKEYFSPGAKITSGSVFREIARELIKSFLASNGKKYDLSTFSINVGLAQFTTIKKLVSIPGRHKKPDGQPGGPQIKETYRQAIYNSMREYYFP